MLLRFYAPKSWGLPLNLAFVAEFSFEKPPFDADARQVKLCGIVEKHIGRLRMHELVLKSRLEFEFGRKHD